MRGGEWENGLKQLKQLEAAESRQEKRTQPDRSDGGNALACCRCDLALLPQQSGGTGTMGRAGQWEAWGTAPQHNRLLSSRRRMRTDPACGILRGSQKDLQRVQLPLRNLPEREISHSTGKQTNKQFNREIDK